MISKFTNYTHTNFLNRKMIQLLNASTQLHNGRGIERVSNIKLLHANYHTKYYFKMNLSQNELPVSALLYQTNNFTKQITSSVKAKSRS